MSSETYTEKFKQLVEVIARLRDPDGGCPWDLEQTHASLKPFLIEECYETLDAIDAKDPTELKKELGDVLLQVVLHAQIGSDNKQFTIGDVVEGLTQKLIRRHPHIFGTAEASTSKQVLQNWERIKQGEQPAEKSALSGIPKNIPALLSAQRLGEKAARLGFDWQTAADIHSKLEEELQELKELAQDSPQRETEFGDILFTITQIARKLGIDAEQALRLSSQKFSKRFAAMEKSSTRPLQDLSAEEWDRLWNDAKKQE